MVIGPTPPGTGVIHPATWAAASKSTSPTKRCLPFSVTRVLPTSITVAPGLIQSPLIKRGLPTATTRMSARRHSSARSRVLECATVTVQLSPINSAAIGLPTMLERPTTSARAPASDPSVSLSSIRQPNGVHGIIASSAPVASLPTLMM